MKQTTIKELNRVIPALVLTGALLALCACRPAVTLVRPDDTGHYSSSQQLAEIFDRFWQAMNNNYVYWDLEPEGYWNGIYDTYKPKFENLKFLIPEGTKIINEDGTVEGNAWTAFDLFSEILKPLHDGHLSVEFDKKWFETPPKKQPFIIPNADRVSRRPVGDDASIFLSDWTGDTPNFWKDLIRKKYVTEDSRDTFTIDPACRIRAATGKILCKNTNGYISYLYFSNFYLSEVMQAERDMPVKPVTTVLEQFKKSLTDEGLAGIIIDVRGNTGGANIDLSYLLSPLLADDLLVAHTRTKAGPSPLDYKPWAPYYIPAVSENLRIPNLSIPVAALCNDYSASCAELTVLAVKSMPNGRTFGTRTWGAIGPRLSATSPLLTNGGSFTGGPFWINVIQAGFQTRGADMVNYDGVGCVPNEEIPFHYSSGIDDQLKAAIEYIDKVKVEQ